MATHRSAEVSSQARVNTGLSEATESLFLSEISCSRISTGLKSEEFKGQTSCHQNPGNSSTHIAIVDFAEGAEACPPGSAVSKGPIVHDFWISFSVCC